MHAVIDQELEIKAFHKIKEMTPALIQHLELVASSDPCLWEIKPRIQRIAEQLKLRYVLVFGSLARNGCGRDVDLAIKLGRRPQNMLEVGRLQQVFESELGAPVDLIVLNLEVPPTIAKTLVDEAMLVYGDATEAQEDLLHLYKKYLDYVKCC